MVARTCNPATPARPFPAAWASGGDGENGMRWCYAAQEVVPRPLPSSELFAASALALPPCFWPVGPVAHATSSYVNSGRTWGLEVSRCNQQPTPSSFPASVPPVAVRPGFRPFQNWDRWRWPVLPERCLELHCLVQ